MKAMVLRKPGLIHDIPLEYTDIPEPEPQSHEILIRIKTCGICSTDLYTVEGKLPLHKLPLIPGHQVVGIVEKKGAGVNRFRKGDRVGIPWLNWACGKCFFCLNGNENLCDSIRFTGYDSDGGYAQYTTISESFAYAIPDGFSDTEAAPLLCSGVIGYRALRLSELKKGECLGIYGFGSAAHITLQIALYMKCKVFVFTRSNEHREHALQLGAEWAGKAEDTPPHFLDKAIIFAPAGGLVLEALRVLRKGGILAVAAFYMTPIPEMDYFSMLYNEKTVRSVTASTRQDAQELLEIAPKISINTDIQVFPLKEANRALSLLKESKMRMSGVLEIA